MSSIDFPVSSHPDLYLTVASGENIGELFTKFEWKSFTNGGYVIRAKLVDPAWLKLSDIATQYYLDKGRRQPTRVVFKLTHPGISGPNNTTGEHLAFMTELDSTGLPHSGYLEFIAVDPPSYYLNQGASSGKAYRGNVSSVIKKVITEYAPGIVVNVSNTTDSDQNVFYMNRMDPKTFIGTLIDWSASVTVKKTNWIVSSSGALSNGAPTIDVKEQADKPSVNYGTLSFNVRTPDGNDIYTYEFLADTFISLFNKQLITHGISTTSERYLDRINCSPPHTGTDSECITHVHDENTANKKNVNIDKTRGFAKPDQSTGAPEIPHDWSTTLLAIPELYSAGDIGKTYDKYIDGRCRNLYMNMLNLVMRCKFRCTGIAKPVFADSHNLGVSKIKVLWRDADNSPYFLDGDWLVYGFHHIVTRGHWYTDVFCARLDYDSSAVKV